jgi:hypothetical protein
MRRFGLHSLVVIVVLGLALAACSTSDPTTSAEYQALEQQLASVTAERDAVLADSQATASRYEKAKANQEALSGIIADPTSYGTESEVLAMLKEMAVPGLTSDDEVFGTADWVSGWHYTLFNSTDSHIKTWHSWLADDGSVGGSLWTWSGSARNGEPFELQGVEISHFDEDGRYAEIVMFYPYPDEEVTRRFNEGN